MHSNYSGWRKSAHSNSSANCVEVATAEHMVGVRDSKQHGHGPILEFTATQWAAFIADVKSGAVDGGPGPR
jgi:hypothetical protein